MAIETAGQKVPDKDINNIICRKVILVKCDMGVWWPAKYRGLVKKKILVEYMDDNDIVEVHESKVCQYSEDKITKSEEKICKKAKRYLDSFLKDVTSARTIINKEKSLFTSTKQDVSSKVDLQIQTSTGQDVSSKVDLAEQDVSSKVDLLIPTSTEQDVSSTVDLTEQDVSSKADLTEQDVPSKVDLLIPTSIEHDVSSKVDLLIPTSIEQDVPSKVDLLIPTSTEQDVSSKVDLTEQDVSSKVDLTEQDVSSKADLTEQDVPSNVDLLIPTSTGQDVSSKVDLTEHNVSSKVDLTEQDVSRKVDLTEQDVSSKVDLLIPTSIEQDVSSKVDLTEQDVSSKVDLLIPTSTEQNVSSKVDLLIPTSTEQDVSSKVDLIIPTSTEQDVSSKVDLTEQDVSSKVDLTEQDVSSKVDLLIPASTEQDVSSKVDLLIPASTEQDVSSMADLLIPFSTEQDVSSIVDLLIPASTEQDVPSKVDLTEQDVSSKVDLTEQDVSIKVDLLLPTFTERDVSSIVDLLIPTSTEQDVSSIVDLLIPTSTEQDVASKVDLTEQDVSSIVDLLIPTSTEQDVSSKADLTEQDVSSKVDLTEQDVSSKVDLLIPTSIEQDVPSKVDLLIPTSTEQDVSSKVDLLIPTSTEQDVPSKVDLLIPTSTGQDVSSKVDLLIPTSTEQDVPSKVDLLIPTSTGQDVPSKVDLLIPTSTEQDVPSKVDLLIPTSTGQDVSSKVDLLIPTSTEQDVPSKVDLLIPTSTERDVSSKVDLLIPGVRQSASDMPSSSKESKSSHSYFSSNAYYYSEDELFSDGSDINDPDFIVDHIQSSSSDSDLCSGQSQNLISNPRKRIKNANLPVAIEDSESSDEVPIQDYGLLSYLHKDANQKTEDPKSDSDSFIPKKGIVKDGCKQIYDKINFCTYCSKRIASKISRHLLSVHNDEEKIREIRMMPKRSKARLINLEILANEGNFKNNIKVLKEKKGEFIVGRRNTKTAIKDFLPCEYCKKFILKQNLWHHRRNCAVLKLYRNDKTTMSESQSLRRGRNLLHSAILGDTDERLTGFFSRLQCDAIKEVIENDDIIKTFVSLKLESLGDKIDQKISDFYRVSQPARTLGRLVLEARSRRPEVKLDLDYLLKPENFDFLIQCAKYMSHKRDEPVLSLGRLIGNLIGHVIQVKIGLALRQNNDVKNREASNFQKLYESEWNFRVNAVCTKKYNIKKRNNIQTIPITDDLKKLRDHIMGKMRSTGDTLSALPNIESWNYLNKLTLVRIILFNKRRRAEVTELKVDDFLNRPNWKDEMNGEISLALTESDRILANRMDMMISGGKSRKNVDAYVLFPPDCMTALNILMETRSLVGIRTSNNYLFARPMSDTPLSGHTDIKDVVNECSNLKCPERITSTSLRKYAATVSQILDMTPKEIETLATHLGHDVNTHKNFYRLHSSTIELSKVSHMLLAMEGGHMNVWKGKKLEDINILDLPSEAIECDDKSDDDDNSCKDVPEEVMEFNDIDLVENDIEEVISCKDKQACESSKDKTERVNHTDKTERVNHTDKADKTASAKVKKHLKRKWSEEENNIVKKKFRIQIEKNVTVTNDELLEVQKTLNNRSLAMIRSKINNMKFGKCN